MKKNCLVILFVASLFSVPSLAQDFNVDSLQVRLRDEKSDTAKAKILSELSYRYAFNQPDTGIAFGQQSLQLSQQLNFISGIASAHHGLSWCYWAKGNYNNSLYEALKSLHLYEQEENQERIAWLYLVLANVYRDIGDYKKALVNAHKSIGLYRSLQLSAKVPIAVAGSVYELQGQLDSAQIYVQKAFELDKVENQGRWGWLPYLLGNIQAKRKHYDTALYYYRIALPLAIKGNTVKDINDIYNGMAMLYLETSQVDSSIYYTHEVLQKWSSSSYRKGELQAAGILAQAYKRKGEKDSTIKYLELSVTLNNTLFNLEKERDIQNLTFSEQLRQDESERERQQFRSKLRLYAILMLGFVVSGIALLWWRNKELRKKAAELLQKQKQETIQEQLKATLKIQQVESDKLRELDAMKSHFFTNISHEFRTPLSLIQGTVEKLEKEDNILSRHSDYQRIHRNTTRLLQLINQLLDLSRLEAGKLSLEPQSGELSSFLSVLAASVASLYESKQIRYSYQVPSQAWWVKFDRDKLEKIITNLLFNAFKFTPALGEVIFLSEIIQQDDTQCIVELTVKDTGIGISREQQPRIFDRFHQVDTSSTRSYEGTGIGLALVKELVELHGGTIRVESQEGIGTAFYLKLPVALTTIQSTPNPDLSLWHESNPSHPWPAYSNGNEKDESSALIKHDAATPVQILVVEDNAELRHFIIESLSLAYTVLEAENGMQGYEQALVSIPDLVISDIMMPQMDGFAFCDKLKTDERTSHVPIILLTAKGDIESKLTGLETGADDYLTKPFKLEELQLRIRNMLENRRRLRDRYNRQLEVNPKEITVTSMDERFLQKALSIMEAHMSNVDFDVDTFSREAGMSRAQLHRKLTALTNLSANEFIRNLRLKRAADLLLQQEGNISQVAYQVGFSSLNYFTKCFRDFYGKTPTEYMRSRLSIKNW